jgi:hypothetical protein
MNWLLYTYDKSKIDGGISLHVTKEKSTSTKGRFMFHLLIIRVYGT